MADSKKTAPKGETKEPAKEGTLQTLTRKVDRLIDRLEEVLGFDLDGDGQVGKGTQKKGHVLKRMVFALGILAIGIIGIHAADIVVWYDSDSTWGTAKITSDGAGTATFTADALVGTVTGGVTGDITTDDIAMSGAAADTLGFNTSLASVTGLYATVDFVKTTTAQTDTDYVPLVLFEGVNDSSEVIPWGTLRVTVDDNTTNTEDSTVAVYAQVAGTDTALGSFDASGLTVVGDVSGTTIGGITEANLLDKTATETVTGAYTFTNTFAASGAVALVGRKAILGKDNTSQFVLESGTCTNGEAVTFTTVFGSGTPQILLSSKTSITNVNMIPYASSISTTGFTCSGSGTVNVDWLAVGVK